MFYNYYCVWFYYYDAILLMNMQKKEKNSIIDRLLLHLYLLIFGLLLFEEHLSFYVDYDWHYVAQWLRFHIHIIILLLL